MKYKTGPIIPDIIENNIIYNTDKDKADAFARRFQEIYKPFTHADFDVNNHTVVQHSYTNFFETNENNNINTIPSAHQHQVRIQRLW